MVMRNAGISYQGKDADILIEKYFWNPSSLIIRA
jgi:hypothetical protein